jgi:hypothetical protein
MVWSCGFCDNLATNSVYGFLLCNECTNSVVTDLGEARRRALPALAYFRRQLGVEYKNPIRIEFFPNGKEQGILGCVNYSRVGILAADNALISLRRGMPKHGFDGTLAHEITHAIVAEHKGDSIEPRRIEEGLAEYMGYRYLVDTSAGRTDRLRRIQYANRLAKRTDDVYGAGIKLLNNLVSQYGLRRVFYSIVERDYVLG